MPTPPDPVHPISLDAIRQARERIASTIIRTPLVRLELGPAGPDIRLKLENLQPINSYKLRGAANAVAMLPEAERARGVWTISAGNAGQGVAYAARQAGVPCTVVAIETAPAAKLERMKALGAQADPRLVRPRVESTGRSRVPRHRRHIRTPVRRSQFHRRSRDDGIGDSRGRARRDGRHRRHWRRWTHRRPRSAIKALKPDVKVWGAEPETASPAARSFAAGSPQTFPEWQASFVDGAGGQSMFPRMWERMRPIVDGSLSCRSIRRNRPCA